MTKNRTESSTPEKIWKFGRDVNGFIAAGVGALALAIPGPNQILAVYAGWNAAQAGFFEAGRRWSKNNHDKKIGALAVKQ